MICTLRKTHHCNCTNADGKRVYAPLTCSLRERKTRTRQASPSHCSKKCSTLARDENYHTSRGKLGDNSSRHVAHTYTCKKKKKSAKYFSTTLLPLTIYLGNIYIYKIEREYELLYTLYLNVLVFVFTRVFIFLRSIWRFKTFVFPFFFYLKRHAYKKNFNRSNSLSWDIIIIVALHLISEFICKTDFNDFVALAECRTIISRPSRFKNYPNKSPNSLAKSLFTLYLFLE